MSIQATLDTIKRVQPALNYLEGYVTKAPDALGAKLAEEFQLAMIVISAGITDSKVVLEYLDAKWDSLPEEMTKYPEDEQEHALERVFLHANTATHTVRLIELFAFIRTLGHTFLSEDNEWIGTHHNTVSDGLDFLHTLAEQEAQRTTAARTAAGQVIGMCEEDLHEASSGDYGRFMAMMKRRAGL